MKKKVIIKHRDPMAIDMMLSGLYKQRIVQNKKIYNRKKLKNGKELIKELSHLIIFYKLSSL